MHQNFKDQLTLVVEQGALADPIGWLSGKLGLPLLEFSQIDEITRFQLVQTGERLELRETGKRSPGPVYVDFVEGKMAHRRKFGGGRGQPLARAVGIKGDLLPTVIDATAGMGRDGFVMASLGCAVTLIERSPVTFALLADGLRRAAGDVDVCSVVDRIALVSQDSTAYLEQLGTDERPDVIYLDPMYPHRDKSALVKKEMRLFREMVGDDLDSVALLEVALTKARKRVVVKRPAKAEPLGGAKPSAEIKSPNTRYDLYFVKA